MSAWSDGLASKLNDLYPTSSSTALSAQATDSINVALSNIQTWAAEVLHKASDLVRPTPQPSSFNDKVIDLLTTYSTASVTTIAALLLSLIFLGYRYLMTYRDSFSGRGSPFLGTGWADPSRNLSGHFEYIDADDDLYTRHRPSQASHDYSVIDDNDPNAPDRIHVRYMASAFPVDFAAYSISDSEVTVKDLRRKVASRIGVDPSRVRLIYKRKELKRNSYPLKDYKMKQNSEVTAIVTDRANNYEDRASPSDSGSDTASAPQANSLRRDHRGDVPPQRPRSQSSVRFRSDENIPRAQPNGASFLSPNGHLSAMPSERQGRDSLRPSDGGLGRSSSQRRSSRGPDPRTSGRTQERGDSRRERDASRGRGPSPAPSSIPNYPPADPSTPLGKLQALVATYRKDWEPKCNSFISRPPIDSETRTKEYLKLSESVMQHVVDKADAIELEGNQDARTLRKALITEVNATLKKLDAVKGS
jgi:hypothetical protein